MTLVTRVLLLNHHGIESVDYGGLHRTFSIIANYSGLINRFYFSGGFYSDVLGYVGTSCMTCPNGSFVAADKAPGTQKQDCKTCPEGKNYLDTGTGTVVKEVFSFFFRRNRLVICTNSQMITTLDSVHWKI